MLDFQSELLDRSFTRRFELVSDRTHDAEEAIGGTEDLTLR